MQTITHQNFVNEYKAGKLQILIDKSKVGDFILSSHADKHYKPAYLFWTWLGIILLVPVPIILLFYHWYYSVIAFFIGFIVFKASRKSGAQFVIENMISNEDFWDYILLHKGAKITDNNSNEIVSEFLARMENK